MHALVAMVIHIESQGTSHDRVYITMEIEMLKRIDSHAQERIRKMGGGREPATLNSDSRISACLINRASCYMPSRVASLGRYEILMAARASEL